MTDDIASLQIRVLTDQVESANRRLATLEATGDRTERSLSKLAKVRFGAVVGGLAAAGISTAALGAAANKATREWLQYDKAIREVNSITSQTRAEFTAMRRDVVDLSVALGVDATTAARGLYQALSAGVPRENAISFLETAAKAAIAGVTTVDVAVDGLTNTINAFKIPVTDAERVADKLFATVVNGKTTFEELSTNLSKASVPAAALGVDLDELLAVVIGITKQGTPTAEAFTQIKATITALLDPSNELQAVYQKLGVESGRAAIQQFGFAGTLEAVRQAYDGNDSALVKALRTSEAYNGVLSVTGANLREVKGATDAVKNSTGLMGTAYSENSATLENALNSLKSSAISLVETMENSLGIISSFTEALRWAAQSISDLSGASFSGATGEALGAGTGILGAAKIKDRIAELEKLKKKLEEAKASGSWLTGAGEKEGGFGNSFWSSGRKTIDGSLEKINKELEALRSAQSKVTSETQKQADAMSQINNLVEQRKKGLITEEQLVAKRNAINQSLKREQDIRSILEQQANREVKATQEAAEAEKARRATAIEQAKEEEKALKEKNKYLDQAAKQAQELATTDRERLDLQIRQVEEARSEGRITDEVAGKAKANLEEQIRLLDERAAKSGGGIGGGSGGGSSAQPAFSALADALPKISDPFGTDNVLEQLRRDEEEIRRSYERRREVILKMTELTEKEKIRLLHESEEKYKDLMITADKKRMAANLQYASDFFGNLSTIASAFGKKGAKIAKAAAIAQTTVEMYASATAAYKSLAGVQYVGPVLGAAAAAAAIAAGTANIQRIKSTEYSGEYEHGGMIPAGKFGLVGEAGPELVQGPAAVTSARTTAGLSGGHNALKPANTIVNVHNYAGVNVETQETNREDQQKQVDIIIRKAVEAVASSIATGQGSVPKAMEKTYPLYRGRTQ